MSLVRLRKEIDRLDQRLLKLLNQRMRLVTKIAALKKKLGLPIFDGRREQEVLSRLAKSQEGLLGAESAQRIFREIFRSSRRLQSAHRSRKG